MMKGQKFEEKVAEYMGGKPVGGPGEPDYVRGSVDGEAKDWDKRMGRSAVMAEIHKGRNEIVSKLGFTQEAVDYKDQYQPKVKLFDWKAKKAV